MKEELGLQCGGDYVISRVQEKQHRAEKRRSGSARGGRTTTFRERITQGISCWAVGLCC